MINLSVSKAEIFICSYNCTKCGSRERYESTRACVACAKHRKAKWKAKQKPTGRKRGGQKMPMHHELVERWCDRDHKKCSPSIMPAAVNGITMQRLMAGR